MTHEVYLAADMIEQGRGSRLSDVQHAVVESSDGFVYQDRTITRYMHLTLAFAKRMPMEQVQRIIAELPRPQSMLIEFDRLEVMGGYVALMARRVPEDLLQYVDQVKGIMAGYGCEVSYANQFKAHVSILRTHGLKPKPKPRFLSSIENMMEPVTMRLGTYKLIDRTDRHKVLWSQEC